MKQIKAKILENRKVAEGFYRIRIESAYLAKNSKPGQFFEVKCSDGNDPLLRRPLGLHRIVNGGIEMLYEVVGKGTGLLAQKKPGEILNVIGPLGNGFSIKRDMFHEIRDTILIAGGIGVAPLLSLAAVLAQSPKLIAHREKKILVLIGACSKKHVLCKKEFKKLGAKVLISTDDGSCGKRGQVTDLLRISLDAGPRPLVPMIYACGPVGMLKEVARIAHEKRIPCQVSLEERMACGVGVCLGCPVRIKAVSKPASLDPGPWPPAPAYKMVCKDGPVFDAEEIAW